MKTEGLDWCNQEISYYETNRSTKEQINGLSGTTYNLEDGKITKTNKESYTFSDLAAGYYLVYVTGGKEIQSSLVTVDADTTTVDLKTEAPSITKTANKETAEITSKKNMRGARHMENISCAFKGAGFRYLKER